MSLLHLTTIFPATTTTTTNHYNHLHPISLSSKPSTTTTTRNTAKLRLQASSENLAPPSSSLSATTSPPPDSAANVVRKFYGGINRHDLPSVERLIAVDCVYEDLVFPRPFVGRKAILEFFGKFIDSISMDLQFVIDAISEEDSTAVGVSWHLEWNGKPFPFSKGCSFYRLELVNGIRQIVYARDCVEPAIKPGESTLIYFHVIAVFCAVVIASIADGVERVVIDNLSTLGHYPRRYVAAAAVP